MRSAVPFVSVFYCYVDQSQAGAVQRFNDMFAMGLYSYHVLLTSELINDCNNVIILTFRIS